MGVGLGIAAGALHGANSVLLPFMRDKLEQQEQENLARKKQIYTDLGKQMNRMEQYDMLRAPADGSPLPNRTFDPTTNPTHDKVAQFLYGKIDQIDEKAVVDFMSTPMDMRALTSEQQAAFNAPPPAGTPEFGAVPEGTLDLARQQFAGDPTALAQVEGILGARDSASPVDPTAGNMYGTLNGVGPTDPSAGVVPQQGVPSTALQATDQPGVVTMPGGQLAEAPTTPGETLVAPAQGYDIQGRAALLGKPPLPVPLFRSKKPLAQELFEQGFTVKMGNISRPGASFEKMTDMRASQALDKFTAGMPAIDATRGLSPAARVAFMKLAPDILRAQLSKLGWDDASVEGAVKSEFGSDARSKSAQYQENQRFLSTQTGPRAAAGERARRGVVLDMPVNQEERDAQAASRFTDPHDRDIYMQGLKDNRARSSARENIVGGREGALALPQTTGEAARSAVTTAGTLQPGTPAFEQEVQRQTAASTIVDAKEANSYFNPQTGQRAKGGVTLAEVNKSHVYLDEGQKKQFANLKGAAAGLAVARTALKDLPRTGSPLQNFAMRKLIGVFQPGKVQRIERMMASAGQSARAISAEVGTLRNEDIDRALKLFDPRTTWTTTQDMEIAISMTEKAFADAALGLGLQPSALGLDMTPKVKSVGEALP